jgi:hypothetical protein
VKSAASSTPLSSAPYTSPPGRIAVETPAFEKMSAIIPPGKRIFFPLKSSKERMGTLEWMMFRSCWIGPT